MVQATFSGRLAIQQRVLPAYRAPFLDALASVCERGLSVFAGQPRPQEHIACVNTLQVAQLKPARNIHFLDVSSSFYQCWQAGLMGWLEQWQPDALIMEANPRYLSSRQAIHWMHRRSRCVLGWGLGAPPLRGNLTGWRRRGRNNFLRQFDGIIAYSQRGAEEYAAAGFPPERIFVALNAVAPKPVQPIPERPLDFRNRPVVLFVGRLQARKRIDELLQACADLPEAYQPELWIVGDGPAREEYQSLAQQIYPKAKFFGARFGQELDAIFDRADLFVLPGTGGLAVQQAMAHGLPVIVAQSDGTQGDLVRPENGWIIAPGDYASLKLTLQQALQDPLRLRRMGSESYRIVAEEINLEHMVAVFVEALSSVQMGKTAA